MKNLFFVLFLGVFFFSCVKKDDIIGPTQKNDSITIQLSVQPIPESKAQNDTVWTPPANPEPRPDTIIITPPKPPKPRG
jgi:hypothetical protein